MKLFLIFLSLVTATFANPVMGQEDIAKPMQYGNIKYVNGGIGEEEIQVLDSITKNYNTKIILSDTAGHYLGNVDLIIKNSKAEEVFAIPSAGPVILLELPSGSYGVEAKYKDVLQKKTLNVSALPKAKTLHLTWKAADGD